jgi:hypothetical protein
MKWLVLTINNIMCYNIFRKQTTGERMKNNMNFARELNRELVEELKEKKEYFPAEEFKALKKHVNKERIKLLGLTLIKGGKYDEE